MEESATFEVNRKRKKYFPSNRFCSVPKCKSRSNEEISLFLFPKNKALKNKWAKVLKIGKRVTKYMYVCSLHFLNSDLKSSVLDSHKRKRYLKKNAVPSQNLPENSSEDEITNDELEVIESKDEVLRQKKENM
ncbi:hypothetical protein O3M35_001963 [Rhynocoris fuscipes]|uniref:THAP-type domain-containing protein n=1 Tax=Rhynocoris fuscipes TaxID=488301 RepID=A0AAW1CRW9_9HEMI